jgi:hypothetical protein
LRRKIQQGNETFLFCGQLEPPDEKGVFTVAIRYRHRTDRGVKIPIADHQLVLMFDETSISTSIGLSLEEPTTAGEAMSRNKRQAGTEAKLLKSRIRHRLTLTKNDPLLK